MLGEARGGVVSPKSGNKLVGDGGGAEEIGDSLGAERRRRLREKEEEVLAFNSVQSRRDYGAALLRIDRGLNGSNGSEVWGRQGRVGVDDEQ